MLSLWLFQTVVPDLHVVSLVVSDSGSRPSCCLSGCFRQWFQVVSLVVSDSGSRPSCCLSGCFRQWFQAFMLSLCLFQTVVPGLHVVSLVVSDSGSRPSC